MASSFSYAKRPSATLVVVIFAVLSSRAESSADVNCPLDCKANAPCVQGNSDNSEFQNTTNSLPWLEGLHQTGFHCQCPAGRTGILCERQYETCNDSAQHKCFHGGKCLQGMKDVYGNVQYYCDCSEAQHNGTRYAGKFCEAEAVVTCGASDDDGEVFCTNGGQCRDNFESYLDQPCICPSGFEGPHCEYQSDTGKLFFYDMRI